MKLTMNDWIEVSGLLLRELIPGPVDECCGLTLTQKEFEAAVVPLTQRTDDVLLAMATSDGYEGTHKIVSSLNRNEIIALFSRWAHYHELWSQPATPIRHFFPARHGQLWRTILLAMISEPECASSALQRLVTAGLIASQEE